jgi:hypothetical protein
LNDFMDSTGSKPKTSRPLGTTVVGIVAIAGGVLSLFGGLSVVSGAASGPLALAIIVLLFGFLGLGLGAGLLMGRPWARMSTIVVYLSSIALGIAEIVYGGMVGGFGGIIRIVAGVVIPVYLSRASAKAFFA